jgi:hypothetical protein
MSTEHQISSEHALHVRLCIPWFVVPCSLTFIDNGLLVGEAHG